MMDTGDHLPGAVAAIAVSHLGSLSPELVRGLLVGAVTVPVPAGCSLRREAQPGPHLELVLSGLLRVYLRAPDGRTLTVRYCRHGSIVGAVSLFVQDYSMPGGIEALVASSVLVLRPDVAIGLAQREPSVAKALMVELSDRVVSFVGEIGGSLFATVRQRIARHLLDLATGSQEGSELIAVVSQQSLADAVGSVREVVVRILRDLRREGIVETRRGLIIVRSPERLLAESWHEDVRSLGQWNMSR